MCYYVAEGNNAWLDNVRLKEPQTSPQMDTPNQPFVIDLLKPLPFSLPTDLNCIFILGTAKPKDTWRKKPLESGYHVKQRTKPQKRAVNKCAGRKSRAQPRVSFKLGVNKDAAGLNIKTHPR